MLNSKGFSFIESLVGTTLIMMMIVTLIPLTTILMTEREILHQKRIFINKLHEELQPYLWNNRLITPEYYTKEMNAVTLKFQFYSENELLKGCVEWKNVKSQAEQICLYGYAAK